jgi:hypothetical protein
MDDNEVRPIFRVLTLMLSAGTWYTVILIVQSEISSLDSDIIPFNLFVFIITVAFGILMFISAVAFTYTTVLGYMPKKLFKMLFGK